MDLDAFEERAAIMEFDGGLSRFQAETLAAEQQGLKRWEVLNAIKRRNSEEARDHREAVQRDGSDNLPGVQQPAEKQTRPVPEPDVQT